MIVILNVSITDKVKLESIEEINFNGHIISYETALNDVASFEEILNTTINHITVM